MSLRERIAKAIAPEAVSLTSDYVARLRDGFNKLSRKVYLLERENRKLRRELTKLKA